MVNHNVIRLIVVTCLLCCFLFGDTHAVRLVIRNRHDDEGRNPGTGGCSAGAQRVAAVDHRQ